jgi:hypothetical protein
MQKTSYLFAMLILLFGLGSCGDAAETPATTDKEAVSTDSVAMENTNPGTSADTTSVPSIPVEISLLQSWHPDLDSDSGCSCTFRSNRQDYKTTILAHDWDKYACMTINGETVLFGGEQVDDNAKYAGLASYEHWITLSEKGDDLLFEEKIDYQSDTWMEDTQETLTRVLFTMDELPENVNIKMVGTVGMGHRGTMRDLFSDAVAAVKAARASGTNLYPYRFHFANEHFTIDITAKKVGADDGGGSEYEGEMVMKTKYGEVVATQTVWGGCGC